MIKKPVQPLHLFFFLFPIAESRTLRILLMAESQGEKFGSLTHREKLPGNWENPRESTSEGKIPMRTETLRFVCY